MTDLTPAAGDARSTRQQPTAIVDAAPKFRPNKRGPLRRPRLRPPGAQMTRVLVLLAFVLVVYGAFAARAALHARHQLSVGRAQLDLATGMTSDADLRTARAAVPLRAGASHLESARNDLEGDILKPLQVVPFLGRQLKSASALSQSGAQSAVAVADALTAIRDLTRTPPPPDGRVAMLRQFQTIVTTARLRLNEVNLGPSGHIFTSLANARNDLSLQLLRAGSALEKSVAVSGAAINLFSGQHTALMLLTNNAEMRAESGMANVLALIRFNEGRATIESTARVADVVVPPGAVAATGDFGARWGWLQPTTDWQELLSSPRFDATAPLAAKMWQASGHPKVDAVIVADPFALQAILQATGPVAFGAQTIGPSNVIPELLHDQYEQFPDQATAARHEELGAMTQAAIAKLDAGGWSGTTLGLSLAQAVRGRHLMIWSATPADEAAWSNVGAGGTVGPRSIGVSLLNRGRNKADYFTYTNAAVDPHLTATGTDVTLTMAIDNRSPATDVPYVIGPGTDIQTVLRPGETVAAGDYVGLLAVTLPEGATDVHIVNDPAPVVFGPDGHSVVIGEQYVIKRGTTQVVTVRFHLPLGIRGVRLEAAARAPNLYWRYPGGRFVPSDASHLLIW